MSIMNIRKWLAPVLYPLSLIYGLATAFRNFLYNTGKIKSAKFSFPVISVGNITVGGTGKTPHVEYLVDILCGKYMVAVLSRGYKRKTKGFFLAGENSLPQDIGDEPYQILLSKKAVVAVSEDRVKGIESLMELKSDIQCIILDDAFQHRSVSPGLSILLVDYRRPLYADNLLPFGNLRESKKNIKRADIIIVSKVPPGIERADKYEWGKKLGVQANQILYFTKFSYGELTPVFNTGNNNISYRELKESTCEILLLTGIANPESVYAEMVRTGCKVYHQQYSDHYDYNFYDMDVLLTKFRSMSKKRIIVTTEKDAVKIRHIRQINEEIKDKIYYLPAKVEFLHDKGPEFNHVIENYVGKYKRSS
jgi:tetraacyldisaccharide 4'-kinase